jgi:hypothetical protein
MWCESPKELQTWRLDAEDVLITLCFLWIMLLRGEGYERQQDGGEVIKCPVLTGNYQRGISVLKSGHLYLHESTARLQKLIIPHIWKKLPRFYVSSELITFRKSAPLAFIPYQIDHVQEFTFHLLQINFNIIFSFTSGTLESSLFPVSICLLPIRTTSPTHPTLLK